MFVSQIVPYLQRLASTATWPPTTDFLLDCVPLSLGIIVAIVVYQLWFSPAPRRQYGVFIPGKPYTLVRSVESPDRLITIPTHNNGTTISELFANTVRRHGGRPCMGTREIISVETEYVASKQKEFEVIHKGDYSWQSYREVAERVANFGSGLREIGAEAGKNIAIYADTKAEWQIAAQAGFAHSLPVVTVYASLGAEAIAHALNEGEVTHIVTDQALLSNLTDLNIPTLKAVVYIGSEYAPAPPSMAVDTFEFTEVEALGAKSSVEPIAPGPDDLAVIMYTSGSTGLPKGVMVSHANIVAAVAGIAPLMPAADHNQRYIAYLPLAHILELVAETLMLSLGAALGYGSPFTLTDNSPKTKKGTRGDAPTCVPTIMAAVPLVLDRIRSAVTAKVAKGSAVKQTVFNKAFNYKLGMVRRGKSTPILDRTVFKAVKAAVGGQLQLLLSGGAPLSKETQEFMSVVMCPIGQGYGLTETCGGCSITHYTDVKPGRAGAPIPSVEVKLVDWDEGNYRNSDVDDPKIGMPRGEICISGGNVTLGYWKQPEKTAESFVVDSDGKRWFYTGDIGQFHPDGALEIIDRKKDLVKLAAGEYVSYGKVEACLKASRYVANIMCYASPLETYCTAIVEPDRIELAALAESLGLSGDEADLVREPAVVAAFLADIKAVAKGKLKTFETPKKITVISDEWLPESGLVTAALKLKRKTITDTYREHLDAMYAS